MINSIQARGYSLIDISSIGRKDTATGPFVSGMSLINQLQRVENSPCRLRRTTVCHDLSQYSSDSERRHSIRLTFRHGDISTLCAENYVCCVSSATLPVNNLGITTDTRGRLVFIRGQVRDLLSGLYCKYHGGYTYEIAYLSLPEHEKYFSLLFMDTQRRIIGREKVTGHAYVIQISLPESACCDERQEVYLTFTEYDGENGAGHRFFDMDADNERIDRGNIIRNDASEAAIQPFFHMTLSQIDQILPKNYHLLAIKPVWNHYQLTLKKGKKIRIGYLDPRHISEKNGECRKISHKPPQSQQVQLGSDPHEKYHAGHPFTSDRKANFSSRHIPLFSSVLDNFRTQVKQAKDEVACGNKRAAAKAVVRAVDPGFEGGWRVISHWGRSVMGKVSPRVDDKAGCYEHHVRQWAAGFMDREGNPSLAPMAWLDLLVDLRHQEALHFTQSDRMAAFFGVAVGGPPFSPGWFAGAVINLARQHNLTITRRADNLFQLLFTHHRDVTLIGLAGTGQGLERTLRQLGAIDYLTLMPFEANAVLITQSTEDKTFSFSMTETDLVRFISLSAEESKQITHGLPCPEEAVASCTKEYSMTARAEVRTEARLQMGFMQGEHVYSALPRSALCGLAGVDLLTLRYRQASLVDAGKGMPIRTEKGYRVHALKRDAALFAEWKVMPIVLQQDENLHTWCYPLPLQEENNMIVRREQTGRALFANNRLSEPLAYRPDDSLQLISGIDDFRRIAIFIVRSPGKSPRKGIRINALALQNETVLTGKKILHSLKSVLGPLQRSSLHKTCTLTLQSHYQRIPRFYDETGSMVEHREAYRLHKIVILRRSAREHKIATLPLVILSLAHTDTLACEQSLGELLFTYRDTRDLIPRHLIRRLSVIY